LRQVLKPGDRATIFAIDEKPRFVQPLSSADVAARQLMTVAAARGYTAFFDSLLAAERYLDQNSSQGRRRVIVVISDGDDTARIDEAYNAQSSKGNHQLSQMENQLRFIERNNAEVLKEIQRAEVTFYSINPSGRTMHLNVRIARSQQNMERMAAATGGAAFVPANDADLNSMFLRIASEIRTQYLLQYYSDNKADSASFRRIVVSTPARPQLRVRAREGYFPKRK
jgi:Ca-activated chloride channel family protein